MQWQNGQEFDLVIAADIVLDWNHVSEGSISNVHEEIGPNIKKKIPVADFHSSPSLGLKAKFNKGT